MSNLTSTTLDGLPSVSMVTLLCMATAAIMMVVVPIFAIRYLRKNYKANFRPLFFGMIFGFMFDMLLYNIIMVAWTNFKAIGDNDLFVAILAAVMSGLVGIVGRTIVINAVANSKSMPNSDTFGNAYMTGIGYALINLPYPIILMIAMLVQALMINLFGVSYVADDLGAEGAEMLAELYVLFYETPSYDFLITGVNQVLLVVISLSLSVIIYAVYKRKVKSFMLLIAAVLSILCYLPTYFLQYEIWFKTQLSMIIVTTLFTAWLAALALGIMKMSMKNEIEEIKKTDAKVVHKAFPDFNKNVKKDF
ncbi:MAG: YhfC family intramembrane metalloprotease [Lachnospiraceae bacterium]|nr:YhfC family intramembrane metalloprotease [Lachnospiraceae bacterium]